jgi:hypothetical protein
MASNTGNLMANDTPKINVARIESDIEMLNTYANDDSIAAFIKALEALRDNPAEDSLADVAGEFNKLGIQQGTVLSYAQYVIVLLSQHPDVHSMDDTPDLENQDFED